MQLSIMTKYCFTIFCTLHHYVSTNKRDIIYFFRFQRFQFSFFKPHGSYSINKCKMYFIFPNTTLARNSLIGNLKLSIERIDCVNNIVENFVYLNLLVIFINN